MSKGEEEFKKIVEIIENEGLQWASFVDDKDSKSHKNYETNNALTKSKNKKLWRELIKEPNYPIDVIIFKMVITEGFDIPRACVLYQVRDTQSKTLDKQVIGRVRRNPNLANFDTLDDDTKELFSKAYVYGIKPSEEINKGKRKLKLKGEELLLATNEIVKEFTPFKSVKLAEVAVSDIDITSCIKRNLGDNKDIFKAYKELEKCDDEVRKKRREFVTDSKKWFDFTSNLERIKDEVRAVVEDYEKYGKVINIDDGLRSNIYAFMDLNGNKFNCDNCMWSDGKDDEFHHDSKSELEWFAVLNRLKSKCCKSILIDGTSVFLFGKNYIEYSNVKFDYYHKARRTSYPDFIFKDKKDTIHIFEVKSINGVGAKFDTEIYRQKIEKLKKAYLFASAKTGYVFYLPIKSDDDWQILSYENGKENEMMNLAMFEKYMKDRNLKQS